MKFPLRDPKILADIEAWTQALRSGTGKVTVELNYKDGQCRTWGLQVEPAKEYLTEGAAKP